MEGSAPPTRPPGQAEPTRLPGQAAPTQSAGQAAPTQPPADDVRYGPGVPATPPAGQAVWTAEQVWRTGHPPARSRRPRRLRRLAGSALTVVLLAAAGVVLFLRFHHAPFHVTDVAIAEQARSGCGVDVTGRITTNAAAGTVSYQWLFRPGRQQPQPLSQSVTSGQHSVYVTVAVEGSGHGSASRTVILQVLGPDSGSASAAVVLRC